MAPSSPKRHSKFIEALPQFDEQESPSTAISTPANELFYSILHEMDEFESRQRQQSRERGGSQSSFDSLPSANGSTRTSSFPRSTDHPAAVVREGRRSINFTRSSLDKELSGTVAGASDGENAGDKLARKFVGRLRALTGGRRDTELKGVPYPGS